MHMISLSQIAHQSGMVQICTELQWLRCSILLHGCTCGRICLHDTCCQTLSGTRPCRQLQALFPLNAQLFMQVNSGMMAPQDFVNAVSTAVARTFNLYPRKGVIAAGSDADVIIFDPKLRHTISAATHHSAVDTNVHEGWSGVGKVRTEAFTPLHIVSFCNVPMYACHRSLLRQALAGHNAAAHLLPRQSTLALRPQQSAAWQAASICIMPGAFA